MYGRHAHFFRFAISVRSIRDGMLFLFRDCALDLSFVYIQIFIKVTTPVVDRAPVIDHSSIKRKKCGF